MCNESEMIVCLYDTLTEMGVMCVPFEVCYGNSAVGVGSDVMCVMYGSDVMCLMCGSDVLCLMCG